MGDSGTEENSLVGLQGNRLVVNVNHTGATFGLQPMVGVIAVQSVNCG